MKSITRGCHIKTSIIDVYMNTNRRVYACIQLLFSFRCGLRSLSDDKERISERYQRLACEWLCNARATSLLRRAGRGAGAKAARGRRPAAFGNHPAFYCNPTRLRNLSGRVMATDKVDVLTPRNCKFYRVFFSLFKGQTDREEELR